MKPLAQYITEGFKEAKNVQPVIENVIQEEQVEEKEKEQPTLLELSMIGNKKEESASE